MSFSAFIKDYQSHITTVLDQALPSADIEPRKLHQAMRYSILNGGKRIRPLLIYAVGKTFNANMTALDACACAVEMIHCYSLIHDDLPAMDDDDLRRGKPTCHKAFDEATAILAGDALQALAFEVLAKNLPADIDAQTRVKMIMILAQACGSSGMAGGQALDMEATGKSFTADYVETMHRKKTGALITASVELAALASGCNEKEFKALKNFADAMGLAFQIQDDILDIESATDKLGKQQGADVAAGKLTYPQAAGLIASKQKVTELYNQSLNHLAKITQPTKLLAELAKYIVQRES